MAYCFITTAVFLFLPQNPKRLTHKLVIIFLLGGLQGLLGWYMVKSGLVDNPRVSQYRLTAHLGAAVFIYGYILWVAFGLVGKHQQRWYPAGLRNFSYLLTSLIFLMILSGGLVAGTRAGLAYPTFPLMGDSFIPQGLYSMAPAWLSAFEDITTIQFNHRMLAYLILTLGLLLVIHICRSHVSAQLRAASYCLVAALLIQVTLGITTLLQHVPVALASSHQAGAIALFTVALFISHNLRRQKTFLPAVACS
ncbi:MAG: COX15/CtaA family protein [Porticoccaceae bacterium]